MIFFQSLFFAPRKKTWWHTRLYFHRDRWTCREGHYLNLSVRWTSKSNICTKKVRKKVLNFFSLPMTTHFRNRFSTRIRCRGQTLNPFTKVLIVITSLNNCWFTYFCRGFFAIQFFSNTFKSFIAASLNNSVFFHTCVVLDLVCE